MNMIGNDWDTVLESVWKSDGFNRFLNNVKNEYKKNICFPKYENIFNALKLTSYKDTKIVIIGQDPYHGEGEAHGLSFSVQEGVKLPPSLQNIFKELYTDLGIQNGKCGDLTPWAKQGVLLLNTVLTVRRGQANSHRNKGWEIFTDTVIKKVNEREKPVVFLLWGGNA